MFEPAYLEVRCEHCQTSFAPGTKQCIHCGGAIGRRLLGFDALAGAAGESSGAGAQQPSAPDAPPALGRIVRFAMIGLVVVTAIARACFEQS
jgi:hypothetical protein